MVLAALAALSILGDYFIKLASARHVGMVSVEFMTGAALYGLTAIAWLYLMRMHSLAEIGVLYSASTLILLAGLGYFVFREGIGLRDLIGLSLAILSVAVMSHET